ncbi:MAG: thiamine phosphate synthase, partial [Victivallaceae bacterium]
STHNPDEIQTAVAQGCSYLNIGPIFPTQTKTLSYHDLGTEAIRAWGRDLPVPFSVMGGIKERHLPELLAAGARHVAMVTEITQAENIAERVRQLRSYWSK